MLLTDRLKGVAQEVAGIRKSFTIQNPNAPGFNVNEGISRRDRLVRLRSNEGARAVGQLANLITGVAKGTTPDYHLREAMGTDDFPLLFGDLLYRQMLGNYVPYPVNYPAWMRIMEVKDFRTMNLYTLEGGQGRLPEVHEHEPYPEISFTESQYTLSVLKYGQRYGISFEMIIQDDLNAWNQRPLVMAVGARRSEDYLATTKAFDVNGPHASFFTAGNANIATGPLTIANLQLAFGLLKSAVDSDGQPIMIDAVTLVVTPQDEINARNILNATELRLADSGGGVNSNMQIYTQNWMQNKLNLAVNPYIPVVASACATNPWMLVANPNDMSQRPAFMFGFMRGRRTPQLFVKDPDAMYLGGGAVDPTEGNFDNDDINYKIRHIFGAAQGDPKMAVASFG